jgi:large subunit ribosomal protein L10
MKKVIENKSKQVDELSSEIKLAKSLLIFEYLGITAKKVTELRKQLHASNAKMYINKNNIFNRAIKMAGINGIEELTGPCAIIISKGDEIIAFKEINSLMKEFEYIRYKSGVLDGNIVGIDKLVAIASLPSREGSLSMLCSVLTASIRNFMYGLKAVGETKQ